MYIRKMLTKISSWHFTCAGTLSHRNRRFSMYLVSDHRYLCIARVVVTSLITQANAPQWGCGASAVLRLGRDVAVLSDDLF